MRVVSLLPSATEIVCALGAQTELVGISHECDFPPAVAGLPVLTRARINAHGSSREIDAAVRAVVHDALSVYAIDEKLLAKLAPDVIVTQDLCEVCAVSLDDVRAAVSRMTRTGVNIVSLKPTRLEHVLGDIERVATALGRESKAREVRQALQSRIDEIVRRARGAKQKPRVLSVEWIEPVMLGGTWMPELIELAGGVALGAKAGDLAPTVDGAKLRELAPDVVLIKPCGFDLERTLGEMAAIERCILAHLPKTARVYATDGNAFFNRPGPRLVESIEILAACAHPEMFGDLAKKHAGVIKQL